jgi:ubiquitin carboxyl-terminal hydrolase 16
MKSFFEAVTNLSSYQITVLVGLGLSSFVLWPTVVEQLNVYNPLPLLIGGSYDMQLLRRKKKVGRYTVGLTNRANDCFANSNLQALASLKGLYTYLVQVGFLVPTGEGESITPPKEHARLSKALQTMVARLNEPVLVSTCVSPWTLLAVLEAIYKSRISRSQHDAHELLHLILETLQNENEALAAARKDHKFKVPEFPLKGATIDRITCSKCGFTPPVTPSMFLVLSLMVPQKRHISLTSLLDSLSSPEFIQDYGCTNCKLQYVLNTARAGVAPELKEELAKYANCPEKLPEALEKALPREITSPIAKSTRFQALPQVLVIHLSRSIYGGYGASRNSCKVSIVENLELFESQGTGPFDKQKVQYKLSAMIRHKGTHQTGHYECFRRKNLDWWKEVVGAKSTVAANTNDNDITNPPNSTTVPSSVYGEPPRKSNDTPPSPALTSNSSSPTSMSSQSLCGASSTSSPPSVDVDAGDAIRGLRPNLPFGNASSPSPASVSLNEISSTLVGSPRSATSSPGPPGVLPPSHQQWWRISDEKVWECTTRDVLKEESGAYLLFYEKV